MKTYNIKNNSHTLKVTSAALLTGSLMVSTFSACSKIKEKPTDLTVSTASNNTEHIDISSETTSETAMTEESYNFTWEYYDTEALEKIVQKKYNNMTIRTLVSYYGFNEDFNKIYTDYINNKYGTNYKSVPFKKANYFFDYIMADNNSRHRYDSYRKFQIICLDNENADLSAFNNKVIFSYLIQNNIPLGQYIQLDSFKSIMGEEIYKYKGYSSEIILKNPKTGNFDKTYTYNKYELYELLLTYNSKLYMLCADNSIKTCNIFDNPEVVELYNKHLKQFYGENAPQIGQVVTREQYMAIYGEEPLDLSYIQGAVMQVPQETMASPVSYIDYDNYNVYYNPNYNMYSEEDTGRSR